MSRVSQKEFEVEQVRAVRSDSSTGTTHCLIKWKDFGEEHTSWEPLKHASNAQESVSEARAVTEWTWQFYLAEPSSRPVLPIGWHAFDAHAQTSMSKYFREYCTDTSGMHSRIECVLSGKFHYEIDFEHFRQTNVQVANKTTRPIRCLPVIA